ncbi:MAG TPA: TonB family protein, partial [Thermoanaerobaculia bacterium]|nr:TonB family protein [Thermoanaerobaculia bacterium]
KARMRGVEGFQKTVAIKKILPHLSDNQDFIDMFIDEAKLAAQLTHNNIIHIYDLGKIQSSYYIAMEYVDGCDLKTILNQARERVQPLTPELSVFIASKIAAALDYAHRKRDFEGKDLGLVHRDVSPQNVLISKEGDIKLCDFGIAKAASKASHTQAGALKGKLQYMSPEQAWGKPIDRRSDVFALATVLFEMLTGRQLFTGENEISILEQVREARVEPPSKSNDEVPPEIDRIVLKALQLEPANRYETAGDMARDLDSVLYEMKPTPTSADLAIYMHRLESSPVVAHAVEPEPAAAVPAAAPPTPSPATGAASTPPGVVMPTWEERRPKKRSMAVPLSIAAVVVLAAAGGGYFVLRGRTSSATPAQITPASTKADLVSPPAPRPAANTTPAPQRQADTAGGAPAAATSTQAAIDPAKVDAEVQKRLAAERAKLEQELRAKEQQAAAAAPPAPILTRRPVQPAQQPIIPQPQQPAVTQSQAPAAAPQVVPPPAATQTVAEQPVPVPQQPKTREGDLVPSGSEDVVARMTQRGNFPYPPMARMERIEGTILVGALISETGHVLQVKVIRPLKRDFGLNDAAMEIVRRSTFSPPMKDGVRVKAWTTVPVDFKL